MRRAVAPGRARQVGRGSVPGLTSRAPVSCQPPLVQAGGGEVGFEVEVAHEEDGDFAQAGELGERVEYGGVGGGMVVHGGVEGGDVEEGAAVAPRDGGVAPSAGFPQLADGIGSGWDSADGGVGADSDGAATTVG